MVNAQSLECANSWVRPAAKYGAVAIAAASVIPVAMSRGGSDSAWDEMSMSFKNYFLIESLESFLLLIFRQVGQYIKLGFEPQLFGWNLAGS